MKWSGETRGGKEGTHPQGQSGGSRTLALLVHLPDKRTYQARDPDSAGAVTEGSKP